MDYNVDIKNMYPDIYEKLYPHVQMMVDNIRRQHPNGISMNEEMLNNISDDIVTNSGLADYDASFDAVVPVVAGGGFRRGGFRGGHGGRGGRGFLRGLAGALLFQQLYGRNYYYPYPYPYYPYPYQYPYYPY